MTTVQDLGQDGDGVVVIYNPAAGANARNSVKHNYSDAVTSLGFRFVATRAPGHATELAMEAAANGSAIVAAMGGDGTINEVARGLLGTSTALGIVPNGSGNGLARHLGIPLDPCLALKALRAAPRQRIDVGRINDQVFLCTAGLGFDAHVSRHFATTRRRGLIGYVGTCVRRYADYRPTPIEARFGERAIRQDCYLMAFANASQYGNDALIAPHANLADGILDLCVVDRMPLLRALRIVQAMMAGTLVSSGAIDFHTANDVTVSADRPIEYHADGEFIGTDRFFRVTLEPLALEIAA